jgi:hypothetical protein
MAKISDWEMGFDVQVKGLNSFILKMHQLLPEVRKALETAIKADAIKMRDLARAKASDEVLDEKTGRYVASIKSEVRSSEDGVFGFVESDDPRVGLFEYGGATPPRDILPNVKQVMAFAGGGSIRQILTSLGTVGTVFASVVHRPVVNYPARPVIHAAFDEMEAPIVDQLSDMWAHVARALLESSIESASRSAEFKAE